MWLEAVVICAGRIGAVQVVSDNSVGFNFYEMHNCTQSLPQREAKLLAKINQCSLLG